jgi:uncharacterized protein (TIGR03086 family)
MADNLAKIHAAALASTRRFVAGIGDTPWDAPTPCEAWDLRTLVNHVVGGNFWVAELTAGKTIDEVGDKLDGDVLGDDALTAYDRSAQAADGGFRRAGAMEAPVAVSYGPVPGGVYAGHRIVDLLVHGWDIATATGQDATLDVELVEAAQRIVEPQADLLEASGMFGTKGTVSETDDPQSRLLAQLGRSG